MLGNPVTELEVEYNDRVPFVHGMALISDELYEARNLLHAFAFFVTTTMKLVI